MCVRLLRSTTCATVMCVTSSEANQTHTIKSCLIVTYSYVCLSDKLGVIDETFSISDIQCTSGILTFTLLYVLLRLIRPFATFSNHKNRN